MKTGWGHVINENGVDEYFAPNTLAPQVLMAEDGPTLIDALAEKIENRYAVIETAHIQEAAIVSALIENGAIEDVHIKEAAISTAKIRDLKAEVLNAVIANLDEVIAGTVQTNELYSKIIMAVSGEIREVIAGDVQTNTLYANIIEAVCADLEKLAASEIITPVLEAVAADIDKLDAGVLYAQVIDAVNADIKQLTASHLYASLADISKATLKDAQIDFAQVQDLIAGKAIITKGVGDKLEIARLAVTEANMVSLTTGELIVKGIDGLFYTITVDDQGNIKPELKTITGENVEDASLGGEKIIENSITATQLNVQEIFANSALVGAITAQNLDVATLFADDAFIGELETHLIQSDYLSVVIQKAPELFESLSMFFDFTTKGLIIRQPDSEVSVRLSDAELGFYQSEQRVAYISNSQLNIGRAKVDSTLAIGSHQWITEPSGGLSLVWIGDEI